MRVFKVFTPKLSFQFDFCRTPCLFRTKLMIENQLISCLQMSECRKVLVTGIQTKFNYIYWLEINISTQLWVSAINQFLLSRGDNLIPAVVILNLLSQKQDQLLEM